jgi:hypothetical protein
MPRPAMNSDPFRRVAGLDTGEFGKPTYDPAGR